jgi:hypothetical protein
MVRGVLWSFWFRKSCAIRLCKSKKNDHNRKIQIMPKRIPIYSTFLSLQSAFTLLLSLRVNLGSMPVSLTILRKRGTKGGLIGTIQS